jgi:hypothetical protein
MLWKEEKGNKKGISLFPERARAHTHTEQGVEKERENSTDVIIQHIEGSYKQINHCDEYSGIYDPGDQMIAISSKTKEQMWPPHRAGLEIGAQCELEPRRKTMEKSDFTQTHTSTHSG